MFRRRPVVARRGPSLVGTMAQTAVIAGTATAVSKGVSNSMDAKQHQAAALQSAQQDAMQAQANAAAMQAQLEAQQVAAQQQPAAASTPSALTSEQISHLQSLAQLRDGGILTEEEFQQQKARLLNG